MHSCKAWEVYSSAVLIPTTKKKEYCFLVLHAHVRSKEKWCQIMSDQVV